MEATRGRRAMQVHKSRKSSLRRSGAVGEEDSAVWRHV